MTYACVLLPFPPSTNNLFAGKARRYVSKSYKAWREEAGWTLEQQEPIERFTGPVSLTLALGRPDKRRRDLSNFVKAIEDLCVTHGIIRDDSDVHRLLVYWTGGVVGVRVEIEPAGAAA
jgi:crossover junction endodeoxyribonuclease RusA